MAKRIIRLIALAIALYLINTYLSYTRKHQHSPLAKPQKKGNSGSDSFADPIQANDDQYAMNEVVSEEKKEILPVQKEEVQEQIKEETEETEKPEKTISELSISQTAKVFKDSGPMGPVKVEEEESVSLPKKEEAILSYEVVSPNGKDKAAVSERFVHSWTIRNTGTIPWHKLTLTCLDVNNQNGVIPLVDEIRLPDIAPGESFVVSVPFDAGSTAGSWTSRWTITDENGNLVPSSDRNGIIEKADIHWNENRDVITASVPCQENRRADERNEKINTPADDLSRETLPDLTEAPRIDDYTSKMRELASASAVQQKREENENTEDKDVGTGTFLFNIDDPTVINTLISTIMQSPDYPFIGKDTTFTNDVFLAFKKSRKQIAFIAKVHIRDTKSYSYIIYDVLTGKLVQNNKLPSLVGLTTTKVSLSPQEKKDAEAEINRFVSDYIAGRMDKKEKENYISYLQKIANAKTSSGMYRIYKYFERKW